MEARDLALADLNAYKQRDELGGIEVLDLEGNRALSTPAEMPALVAGIFEFLPQENAKEQIIIAGFYRDAVSGEIYIPILIPVSNGAIALRVNPQTRLYPILAEKITGMPSTQSYLARRERNDTVILSPLPYEIDAPLNLRVALVKTDSLETKAASGERGIVDGLDYRGVEMIADVRETTKDWVLVTQTSAYDLRDTISLYFWRTVVVTGTIVFYAGLGLALIWRQQLLKRYQVETREAQERAAELDEKVRERTAELSALSRQMADMHEKQIRDLARELHDGVGQNLTAINLNLTILRESLSAKEATIVWSRLTDTSHLVEETVARMRNVMADFLPPMLEHYGLTPALDWYGEQFTRRTNVKVQVDDLRSDAKRLPPEVEVGLFRVTQEALNNVAKHARASQVEIELSDYDDGMQMMIQDDGVGFESQAVLQGATHWGFAIMRERARSLGATFEMESALSKGTRIILRIGRQA